MRKSILKLFLLCFLLLCPNSSENINAKNKNTELINITFINGNEIFKEEKIIKGTSVGSIESPKANADQTYFLGWHQNHLLNSPFDLSTPIHQSKTLYAKFSNEYMVNFKGVNDNVIDTVRVKKNQKVSVTEADTGKEANQFITHWYLESDSKERAFDFNSTIITSDITLKPKFSTDHLIVFNTNGGDSITKKSVENGTSITLPTPNRKGYSFVKWQYEGKDVEKTITVNDSMILNAVWQEANTDYKIVIYGERAQLNKDPGKDVNNYIFMFSDPTSKTALTNSEIQLDEDDYKAVLSRNASDTTSKLLSQAFEFGYSNKEKVRADGTTVLEIYAKRRVIEFQFDLKCKTSYPDAYFTTDNHTHKCSDGIYTFNAKYEDNIGHLWPNNVQSGKSNIILELWQNTHATDKHYGTKRTTFNDIHLAAVGSNNFINIPAQWLSTTNPKYWQISYYFEDPDDPNNFIKDDQEDYKALRKNNADDWKKKEFIGYSNSPTGSNGQKDIAKNEGDCITGDVNSCFRQQKFYYYLKSHDLIIDANGGKFVDGTTTKTSSLKYKSEIEKPETPTKENHTFAGWYTSISNNIEVNFDDDERDIMPHGDYVLNAKWIGTTNDVVLLEEEDGEVLNTESVEKDQYINLPDEYIENETYVKGKGIFKGWYFIEDGQELKFSESIAINQQYTVYAKWQSNGFVFTYDLDGGNATTPKDKNYYAIDTKARIQNPGIVEKENQIFVGFKRKNDPKLYYPYEYIDIKNNEHLTAVYTEKSSVAKVTYHHNLEEVNAIVNYMAIIDDKINLAGKIFDHEQYQLLGWSTDKNATTVEYDLESTITVPSSDIDLYAVWKHHDLKISFISDPGGKLDYTPINSGNDKSTYRKLNYLHEWTKEDSEKVPNVIADEGYRFVGWDPVLPTIGDVLEDNYIFVAMFEQMEPAKITVIHQIIDENNDYHEVKANDEINTYLDEKYDLKNYVVDENGYELSEESKSIVTGQVSETSQTIILTYKKQAKVTIKYVDDLNNSIDSKTYHHYWYESFDYNNDKKDIEGYTLLNNNVELSGLIKEDEVVLTIKYARNTTLTIKYVNDADTPLIKTNEVVDTYVGASVDISTYLPTILEECQYSHLKNQSDKNISIDTLTKEVIAVYNRQASVTINYVDQDNKSIHDPYVLNTYMHQSYDLSDKNLDLLPTYKYHTIDGALTSSKLTQLNTIITIKYLKQAKITINHIDDTNYTFISSTIDTYYLSEEYDLNDYDFNIDNYKNTHIDQPLTGTLSDDLVINATYVRKAILTINYLNDVNETFADSQTINTYTQEDYDLNTYKLSDTDHQYSHELNGLENTGKISDTNFVINLVYNRPATVYIHHVDDTGNKIENVSSHTHNSYMNNAYDLSNYSKEISNHKYNKVKTGSLSEDSISNLETHIELEYLRAAQILIKHENDLGQPISQDITKTVYMSEKYDYTDQLDYVDNHQYSHLKQGQISGSVNALEIELIAVYNRSALVTVNYLDHKNNSIKQAYTLNSFINQDYDLADKKVKINNYVLLNPEQTMSGKIDKNIVINLRYAKKTTLTLKYEDDNQTKLQDDKTIDTYLTNTHNILEFTPEYLNDNKLATNTGYDNVIINQEDQTMTIVYNRQASVTINYVDQDNKAIHDPYVLNTYMNQSYDLSDKKLDLLPTYKYHSKDGALTSNKITQLNTIITIKYLKQAKITINHIDDTNYTFKSSTIDTYYLSEEYDLNDYDFNIDNYDLKNVDQPLTGTLSDDLVINATYVRKAVLTINYLNDVNETFVDSQTINMYTQEDYDLNTYKLSDTDHQYSHELNGLENTGKISDTNFVINLVYNRPATVYIHHVDDTGNKIENVSSYTHNSYMNNAYDLSSYSKEISNHKYNKVKTGSLSEDSISNLETHIELEYLRAAQIMINYIDDTNNQIKDQTIITDKYINDEYDLSNFDFAIDKYKLSTIDGDLKASIKDKQIVINAYYNRQAKFTLNFVDENNKNIIDSIEDKTTYYINDDYDYSTLTEKFEDYFFIESSLELTGKVNDVNNEITLKYQRKEASITLKFTTKTRVKLADDVILDDYKINDDYDLTKYKDYLEHYDFVNSDIDLVGKVKNKETTIILIFSEIPANVILVHQDENEKEIKEKDIHKTYLKRDYDFSAIAKKKSIDDYVFVKADKALQGIVEQPELKITLTYKKNTTNNNANNSGNNNGNNNNNSNNANNNKPSNSTNQSNNKTNDKNKDKQTNSNLKNAQTIKQNTPQTGSMLIIYTTCFILLSLLSIYLYKYYL